MKKVAQLPEARGTVGSRCERGWNGGGEGAVFWPSTKFCLVFQKRFLMLGRDGKRDRSFEDSLKIGGGRKGTAAKGIRNQG